MGDEVALKGAQSRIQDVLEEERESLLRRSSCTTPWTACMSLVGCLDSAWFVQRESGCGVRQRAAALSCRRLSAVGGERSAVTSQR